MSFLKSLINDADKSVNPIQVVTLVLGLAIVVWGTHVAFHTHAMPNLNGIGEALGGAGLANVAHKTEDIIDRFRKTPIPPPVMPAPPAMMPPPPMMAPPA